MNEVKLKLTMEGGQVVSATIDGVTTRIGALDDAARTAASGSDTLKTALTGMISVGAAMALVKMADAATTLQTQLRLSSNSAAEAKNAYGQLFSIAQQGRVSFTELGNTYASVARAGKELGVSQSRLLDVTKSISQAMAIGGGSAASMQAALVQLGQGLSSGTLRGEELNSIMEQTPRLAKAIADGLGVPIGKLRELGQAGELTAQQVIGALEKAGPALAKEMESATLTVGQAFTMLGNSTVKFVGDADKASGASTALASVLKDVSGAIDTVGSAINNNQVAFAAIAGGIGGTAAVAGLAAVASNIGKIRVAFIALSAVMAANPITLTLMGIGAAVGGAYALVDAHSKTLESMKAELKKLESSNGVGIYGIKSSDAAMQKNLENISRLRGAIAELESASNQYGNAEDKRLSEHTQGYKAEQQQIQKISDLMAKSSGVSDAYIKRMREIGEANATGAMSQEQLATAIDAAQKLLPKAAAGAQKLSEAQKLVNAGEKAYGDIMAKDTGYAANFTETILAMVAARDKNNWAAEKYDEAVSAYLAKQSGAINLAKEQIKAFEDQAKATDKATVALGKYYDELEMRNADTDQIGIDYEAATKGMLEYAALEASLMGQSAQAREAALAQYQAQRDLEAEILRIRKAGGDQATVDANIAIVTASATSRAAVASQQKYAAEWNKTYDRIESGLTDALMTGGKEGAQQVREMLVQTLVSEPFEIVVRALLQPITSGLTNMAMGAVGEATGMGSLLSGASSASSLYSMGSKAYGWLTGAGTTSAYALGTAGTVATTGVLGAGTVGSGLLAGGAGTAGSLYSLGGAATGGAIGGSALGTGLTAGSLGTGLTAGGVTGGAAVGGSAAGGAATTGLGAIPVAGWVALAAIAAYSIFGQDPGGPKTEASYGPGASPIGDTSTTGFAGKYTTGIETAWDDLAKTLGLTSDLIASTEISIDTLGEDLTNFNASATLDGQTVSSRRDRMGGMDAAQVGRSEQELADAMALETTYILFEALQASDLGAQAKAYLGEVDASLTAMANDADRVQAMSIGMENIVVIHDFQAALENLPFVELRDLGFNAAKGLIEAAGGLDALSTNLSGYYNNFYSVEEKATLLTANTARAFEKLGLTMPAVDEGLRAAYRSEIERLGAMDLSVEANARAYAGALALQGSVNTLATSFDEAAQAAETAAAKLADAMKEALETALTTATAASNTAYAGLEASVAAERTAVQEAYEAASKALDARADKIQTDYDKAVEAQNAQRDQASNDRAAALDGLSEERKAAASAYSASSKALSDQQQALSESYGKASDAINASIEAAQTSLSLISGLDSALQGAMDFFRQNDNTLLARQTAQDQIAAALIEAQAGRFPTAEGIADAIAAVTRPSEQLFASYTDYKRDYYKTAISLDALQRLSGKQLTKEEAQLKALESTKTAIDTANERQLEALELQRLALTDANELLQGIFDARQESIEITYKAVTDASTTELERLATQYKNDMAAVAADRAALDTGYQADMKVFDDILANARKQLEVAQGIYAEVLTIPGALTALGAAISALEIERTAQGQTTTPAATSTNPTAAYFATNPDVAAAYQANNYGLTAQQFADTHYALYGQEEARNSPTASTSIADALAAATTTTATTAAATSAAATAAAATTTAAAATTMLTATMQAAVANGILEGKSGLAKDSASQSYFDLYKDVSDAFAVNAYGMSQKEYSAYHWLHHGQGEGRYFPGFAVGTNYVPKDMLAQIHEGEAIIPKAFNPESYARASGNDALVVEIKALRAEVKQLREENNASQRAIATSSNKTAKILERVTPDGASLQTTVAV